MQTIDVILHSLIMGVIPIHVSNPAAFNRFTSVGAVAEGPYFSRR